MTALSPQTPTTAGIIPTYAAAASQMTIAGNTGRTYIHVKNGSGGSINVTLETQAAPIDGNVVPDKVIAVAAGAEKIIGPFPPGVYNDPTGMVTIDFSSVTTITVACIQIP